MTSNLTLKSDGKHGNTFSMLCIILGNWFKDLNLPLPSSCWLFTAMNLFYKINKNV